MVVIGDVVVEVWIVDMWGLFEERDDNSELLLKLGAFGITSFSMKLNSSSKSSNGLVVIW